LSLDLVARPEAGSSLTVTGGRAPASQQEIQRYTPWVPDSTWGTSRTARPTPT
jgi:hypothetical protein